MARPKKAVLVPKPEKDYSAVVVFMGKKYSAVGSTVSDALSKLTLKNPKGKSVLIVERNGVKKEKILMPMQTYRLFNSFGLTKEVAIKNVSLMFQGL